MNAENDGSQSVALSDRLVSELQRRILSGETPVGSWLRHGALAEEFGTSRTPVREALRVLSAQGVVTIVKNRGARVNGHSGRDIRELGEVRAELEGLAAALAAAYINDAQIQALERARAIFESLAEHPSEEMAAQWSEANDLFHATILESSGNKQLRITLNDISRRLPKNMTFAAYEGNSRLIQRNLIEHRDILDAILQRDEQAARNAMAVHVRSSSEAMARWAEDNARLRD